MTNLQLQLNSYDSLLSRYEFLFQNGSRLKAYYTPPSKSTIVIVTIPYPAPLESSNVLFLKDGGCIRGRETIMVQADKSFDVIHYSYHYENKNYKYSCSFGSDIREVIYQFRYEKDAELKSGHPLHHLHVIHDSPRFKTDKCSFEDFLKTIAEGLCKKNSATYKPVPAWLAS